MTPVKGCAVVAVLGLAGCAVTAQDIAAAQRLCAGHEGIDYIPAQAGRDGRILVRCKDGSEITGSTTTQEARQDE